MVTPTEQRDAYVRDEDGNVAWHAISEEGDLCPVCNHPPSTHDGPVYDGCTWVNGYGHMEGDHLCGCPLAPRINLDAPTSPSDASTP